MMGVEQISPEILRRNIVVSVLNLLALKGKRFKFSDAVLEYSGLAHPCSRIEEALGPGGYDAMRGLGGITSSIVSSGQINLGDKVLFSPT
jgi:MOSC domain-containing protein YiiM|tara:strand:+ start:374 stop:643 length:270 start_codon:yes stop_codon:yes gene_type:complete